MKAKTQTEATNSCPFNLKQNPIQLLTASLQYLCAYTKALAREEEPLDEKMPAPVICLSPDQIPYIDFSDRVNLPEMVECVSVIEETTVSTAQTMETAKSASVHSSLNE